MRAIGPRGTHFDQISLANDHGTQFGEVSQSDSTPRVALALDKEAAKRITVQRFYDTPKGSFRALGYEVSLSLESDSRGNPQKLAIITRTPQERRFAMVLRKTTLPQLQALIDKFDRSIRSGINHITPQKKPSPLPIMQHLYQVATTNRMLVTTSKLQGVLELEQVMVQMGDQRVRRFRLLTTSELNENYLESATALNTIQQMINQSSRSLDIGDREQLLYDIENLQNFQRLASMTDKAKSYLPPETSWDQNTVARVLDGSATGMSLSAEKLLIKHYARSLIKFAGMVEGLKHDIASSKSSSTRRATELFLLFSKGQGIGTIDEAIDYHAQSMNDDQFDGRFLEFLSFAKGENRVIFTGISPNEQKNRFRAIAAGLNALKVDELAASIQSGAQAIKSRWLHKYITQTIKNQSKHVIEDRISLITSISSEDFESLPTQIKLGLKPLPAKLISHTILNNETLLAHSFDGELTLKRDRLMQQLKSRGKAKGAASWRRELASINFVESQLKHTLESIADLRSIDVTKILRKAGFKQVQWTRPTNSPGISAMRGQAIAH
jgi:hypothetical protein